MSNFKVGDLIVPNDKFLQTSSIEIGNEMGLSCSVIDGLKEAFNNNLSISSSLRITNIYNETNGTWIDVRCVGHPIAIEYGHKVDDFSYLAEYFELYEEKEKSNNLVLDYKLIDKLI